MNLSRPYPSVILLTFILLCVRLILRASMSQMGRSATDATLHREDWRGLAVDCTPTPTISPHFPQIGSSSAQHGPVRPLLATCAQALPRKPHSVNGYCMRLPGAMT